MLSCGSELPLVEIDNGESAVDGDGTWSLNTDAGDEKPRKAVLLGAFLPCVPVPGVRVLTA